MDESQHVAAAGAESGLVSCKLIRHAEDRPQSSGHDETRGNATYRLCGAITKLPVNSVSTSSLVCRPGLAILMNSSPKSYKYAQFTVSIYLSTSAGTS